MSYPRDALGLHRRATSRPCTCPGCRWSRSTAGCDAPRRQHPSVNDAGERAAVHWLLLDSVDRLGLRDAGHVEDRRSHVDDVGELGAQPAGILDAIGPVHDHGIAGPAEVRAHLLAPLEGRGPGPRPRRRVVGIHDGGAPLVEPAVEFGELELHLVGERDAVLHRELVERAGDRPLHAGPVVTPDPQNERVVELTELFDGVDDPADVVVGVLREPGIDLHLAGIERPSGCSGTSSHAGKARSRGVSSASPGSPRAPSGERTSPRGACPTPGRTSPCTCRPTPWPRGGGHGCSRWRSRRRTACGRPGRGPPCIHSMVRSAMASGK